MVERWTYLACDVMTGNIIDELPMSGVSFTRTLKGSGDLSGTVELKDLSTKKRGTVLTATEPGQRAIYPVLGGKVFWGGMIWPRPWTSGQPLSITAGDWGTYFNRVILRQDKAYNNAEQLAIAKNLIDTHQALAGGNVRVNVTGWETTGRPRVRNYLAGDVLVIGELIDQLSNVIDGFDYTWGAEFAPDGKPRGVLRLGYPRLGATNYSVAVETGPTDARSVSFNESAAELATTSWAIGEPATEGGTVPVASASDPALLTAGYPILDKVRTYSDVSIISTLQEHADADQEANGGPLVNIEATISLSRALSAALDVGDPVRVLLQNERFPAGYEDTLRVTSMTYHPAEQTVDLVLSPRVLVGGRVPVTEDERRRIARLSREVRRLHISR